jgi:hypothetical protein
MISGNTPPLYPCQYLVDIEYNSLPVCAHYTNCSSESINVTLPLIDKIFRYSYIMVQNNANERVDL